MKYIKYGVYIAPETPTENGKYYGRTSILEQAQVVVKHLFEHGTKHYI